VLLIRHEILPSTFDQGVVGPIGQGSDGIKDVMKLVVHPSPPAEGGSSAAISIRRTIEFAGRSSASQESSEAGEPFPKSPGNENIRAFFTEFPKHMVKWPR
jgi:hypothetical protein